MTNNDNTMTVETAVEKLEKWLDLQAETNTVMADEMIRKITEEGKNSQAFLLKNDLDKLIEVYKNHHDKLSNLIVEAEELKEKQTKKIGKIKSIKAVFSLAASVISLIALIFSFVAVGGSIAQGSNLGEADKVYHGWLDSSDAKVVVEQLGDEYFSQYKTGEISYDDYIDKMNSISKRENLEKFVSLPSAQPYIDAAEKAEKTAQVGRIGALSGATISLSAMLARLGVVINQTKKQKEREETIDKLEYFSDKKYAAKRSLDRFQEIEK